MLETVITCQLSLKKGEDGRVNINGDTKGEEKDLGKRRGRQNS